MTTTTSNPDLRRAVAKLRNLTDDEAAELTGTTLAELETSARRLLDRRHWVAQQRELYPHRPEVEIVGQYDGGGIVLDPGDTRATVAEAVANYRSHDRAVAIARTEDEFTRRARVAARLAGTTTDNNEDN